MKNLETMSQDEILGAYVNLTNSREYQLASAVSHDVKNPLGIIELSLGLLEDKVESLLEGQDEKIQSKVKQLLGNIEIGISRCQEVLNISLDVTRQCNENNEEQELGLCEFITKYHYLAKPYLKSSMLSLDVAIDEGLTINTKSANLARAIVHSLSVMAKSVSVESGGVLTIEYVDKNIQYTVSSREDLPVHLIELEQTEDLLLKTLVSTQLQACGYHFDMSKKDNAVIGVLSPK